MSYVLPIAYPDPPYIIDTSITPIPSLSGNPLQIIEDTGVQTGVGVSFNDQTGNFIGVFLGAEGSEILLNIIGNGISGVGWGRIPPNSRISIRSMTAEPIVFGLLGIIAVTI